MGIGKIEITWNTDVEDAEFLVDIIRRSLPTSLVAEIRVNNDGTNSLEGLAITACTDQTNRIEAIKWLRQSVHDLRRQGVTFPQPHDLGLSLKAAKDLIDAHWHQYHA